MSEKEQDELSQSETHATRIVQRLRDAGFTAYWAGGCVRDRLMGRAPKDIDIATNAPPDAIPPLFEKTVAIGKSFGVIGVVMDKHLYEVATFRRDAAYEDGRRPTSVTFTDAKEDAQRRDFTVNALFYDPLDDKVIDYVDGVADIERRVLRTVGRAEERFQEDHLRLLRAIRFASVLDFTIEPATFAAIQTHADLLKRISVERIQQELTRTWLEAIRPGDALQLLLDSGLLRVVLPEVAAMDGQEQPPEFHPEGDVFQHTKIMMNLMGERDTVLAWSVLLHDIGKPPTASLGPGRDGETRIRFDGHDKVGERMAREILSRLRFPNKIIEAVCTCIGNHMRFMHVQEMRNAKLRRFVGSPFFDTEMELHRLDCLSSHGMLDNYTFLQSYMNQLAHEPVLPEPWLTGHDILAMGVPKGPEVGRWLRRAYELQLEGAASDRESLLALIRKEIK